MGLIALLYAIGGINEWTTRLPSAGLTLASVPLLYSLSRELFHQRLPAVFATLVYLTSLPVIRNGRFAMLDGAVLCFLLLLLWCLLPRPPLTTAICWRRAGRLGCSASLKGLLLGGLLGGIALAFLAWDTPRLLRQPYLWLGFLLGGIPVAGWYGAQWLHYGAAFWGNNLMDQSLARVWTDLEDNGGAALVLLAGAIEVRRSLDFVFAGGNQAGLDKPQFELGEAGAGLGRRAI